MFQRLFICLCPNVENIIVQYINQCPSWRTLHLTLHKQVMDCRRGLVIAFCFFLVTMMYTNGVIFLNICSGLSETQSQSVWVCWAGWVRLIYWNMIVVRPEDNSKHLYSLYLHHISISPWIWALLSIAFRSICSIQCCSEQHLERIPPNKGTLLNFTSLKQGPSW